MFLSSTSPPIVTYVFLQLLNNVNVERRLGNSFFAWIKIQGLEVDDQKSNIIGKFQGWIQHGPILFSGPLAVTDNFLKWHLLKL